MKLSRRDWIYLGIKNDTNCSSLLLQHFSVTAEIYHMNVKNNVFQNSRYYLIIVYFLITCNFENVEF